MQVNKIASYYAPKANLNSQNKMSKPISFGEEVDGWGPREFQNYNNAGINRFFEKAENFTQEAKRDINFIKEIARKAYRAGAKNNFARFSDQTFRMNGIVYDAKYAKNGDEKTIVLENASDKLKFYFDRDSKGMPKAFKAECENEDAEFTFLIDSDCAFYSKKEKDSYANMQTITFNKDGYVYEEKEDFDSTDYKKAIVRKFPHASESQYIVNRRWSDGDETRIYMREKGSKDWIMQNEN